MYRSGCINAERRENQILEHAVEQDHPIRGRARTSTARAASPVTFRMASDQLIRTRQVAPSDHSSLAGSEGCLQTRLVGKTPAQTATRWSKPARPTALTSTNIPSPSSKHCRCRKPLTTTRRCCRGILRRQRVIQHLKTLSIKLYVYVFDWMSSRINTRHLRRSCSGQSYRRVQGILNVTKQIIDACRRRALPVGALVVLRLPARPPPEALEQCPLT